MNSSIHLGQSIDFRVFSNMEVHWGLFAFAKPFPECFSKIRECLLLTPGRGRAQPRVLARLVKESVMSRSAPDHKGQQHRVLPSFSCQHMNKPLSFPLSQWVCHWFRQIKDLQAQSALLGYKHSCLRLLETTAALWHQFLIKHSTVFVEGADTSALRSLSGTVRRAVTVWQLLHQDLCLSLLLLVCSHSSSFFSAYRFLLFTYKCFFNTLRLCFCSYLGHT